MPRTSLVVAFTLIIHTVAWAEEGLIPAALIHDLNRFLDAETEFSRRDTAPRITLVDEDQVAQLQGVADRSDGNTRGLYDDATGTIYLTAPWSANNRRDVSVLVHELVHHRQSGQHWYCPQAQEWRAYQIQAQWLQAQGIASGFYWPAIVLQSSCSKRDIHPN